MAAKKAVKQSAKRATKKAATRGTKKAIPRKTAAKKASQKAAKRAKPSTKAPAKRVGGRAGTAGKAEGEAPVRAYIASLPDWKRDVAQRLDDVIAREVPKVKRAIKWSVPFYGLEGQGWFASFGAFSKHVKIQFFRGVDLKPQPPLGESRTGRALDLRGAEEFDEKQIRGLGPPSGEDSRMGSLKGPPTGSGSSWRGGSTGWTRSSQTTGSRRSSCTRRRTHRRRGPCSPRRASARSPRRRRGEGRAWRARG